MQDGETARTRQDDVPANQGRIQKVRWEWTKWVFLFFRQNQVPLNIYILIPKNIFFWRIWG
jgi:hypothetical protein